MPDPDSRVIHMRGTPPRQNRAVGTVLFNRHQLGREGREPAAPADSPTPSVCMRTVNICTAEDAGDPVPASMASNSPSSTVDRLSVDHM